MRRNRTELLDPIRRGTTPTVILKHPYDLDIVEGGYITFSQRGEVIFEKRFDDDCVEVLPRVIMVDLTREETLKLTTVDLCRAQMLFVMKHEKTAASGIYKIPVLEIMKGGEIR